MIFTQLHTHLACIVISGIVDYIRGMIRSCITYSLILLVLFTHSTIAMDIHISSSFQQPATTHAEPINHAHTHADATVCLDAGGHCSHHQAHTTALVSAPIHITDAVPPALATPCTDSLLTSTFSPPLRPPKANIRQA